MWYIKCSWTLLVFVVLFTAVKGSCLEYGHSCWGAHGKRSGLKAATKVGETHKQLPTNYENNMDELFNNNHINNNNIPDDGDNNNNSDNNDKDNVAQSVAPHRSFVGVRYHRLRLGQLQQQEQQQQQLQQSQNSNADNLDKMADNTASAESWRQRSPFYSRFDYNERRAALHKALQQLAEQQQQRQQLASNGGELYELKK